MTVNINSAALAAGPAKAISISDVNLYYGALHVLKNINLEIQPGEFFAFLGPSGCGKTTLLRLIAGFNNARQGKVVIGGQDVLDMPAWKRDIGMVFQSYALWPHMTVAANVAFGLEERRLARAEVDRRVKAALDLVGLKHLADRRPSQLSGGQQQRVALARALITDPEALLLDEPLSALDPFLKIRMRAELKKLQTSLGITFVHVTHSQEEAMALADIIVIMNDGRIEQAAHPRTVFERPATAFVAKFMGDHNVISGRVIKSAGDELMISVPAGGVFLAIGAEAAGLNDTADIAVRTDHVRVAPATEKGLGFTGSVSNVEYRGSSVKLTVNGSGVEDFTAILSDKDYFANPVKVGDAIPLSWEREDALVLGRLKH